MLNTVHAGGEQSWKSGHLEPFPFWTSLFYNIRMSTEQIVEQFQQIVDTLQKIIAASQGLNERVETLERGTGDTLGALTSIQGNLQMLLENYRQQAETQNKINRHIADAVANLEAKVAAIENGRPPLPPRETIQ
jgi:hypothetical protein